MIEALKAAIILAILERLFFTRNSSWVRHCRACVFQMRVRLLADSLRRAARVVVTAGGAHRLYLSAGAALQGVVHEHLAADAAVLQPHEARQVDDGRETEAVHLRRCTSVSKNPNWHCTPTAGTATQPAGANTCVIHYLTSTHALPQRQSVEAVHETRCRHHRSSLVALLFCSLHVARAGPTTDNR